MYDEGFHRRIATLSYSKFENLPKSGKPTSNEWTILSTITMEIDGKLDIVSLATGSKCIGAKSMSSDGDILNDSHAEVLCRRGFIKYLYLNLNDPNLFVKNDNKFKLKDSVKFHFFTTHVPCGDATIFPKNADFDNLGNLLDDSEEPSNKMIKLDTHRTGAKCLLEDEKCDPLEDGLNYHAVGAVRTKPGRGDPTLSVSCSDKLAKWMHLGLQGSLLSILIEAPIHLTSFTIAGGTTFNVEALNRALINRFLKIQLEPPYNETKTWFIAQSDVPFKHCKDEMKQACPSSIIYYKNEKAQVAVNGKRQGVTKKNRNTAAGRLSVCRIELFREFVKFRPDFCDATYDEAKKASEEYLRNWVIFKEKAFKVWPQKCNKLVQFKIK
ncbi:PREDICTED: tRNA-specific adenosine deaminase 1 [Nicrophorus vespilloides]|uniref:tRNA-specific adenosine deaminase 1 n=1 Tax=Nicrophorus vespilloides TaxID=110193 RepID=A0ABM1ME43_NICVS|nr:PREDICTED: tRNA-specific adenosine deaminase 1 [Nicrophorus vespilloides]